MAVTETEGKQFVFVQGLTTITKNFTSPTIYTITIRKGTFVLTLVPSEFADFLAAVEAADAQDYTPDV